MTTTLAIDGDGDALTLTGCDGVCVNGSNYAAFFILFFCCRCISTAFVVDLQGLAVHANGAFSVLFCSSMGAVGFPIPHSPYHSLVSLSVLMKECR
jgi:hypothetical protein